MVLLDAAAVRYVRSWLGEPRGPGLLDLHHALATHGRGLWGDDARVPGSVLLVREGAGQLEAFGAGDPEPAVGWLCRRAGRPVALLAPRDWWGAVGRRNRAVERVEMQTLSLEPSRFVPVASPVATRRLNRGDSEAFVSPEVAPDWALSSWVFFEDLVEHGAGFVVPSGVGYASLAWIYSQADPFEAIGVSTVSRFRRLGLGRAAASALIAHIIRERRKVPLWTTTRDNAPSLALARSLGFSVATAETFLRWRPASGFPR